ncbi:MAG TPA: hypothetical protein DF911_01810 [Erysipelotrichaceae bacterium]|nr:hypothetical protein [Erysipelotrichaceae bacterium]
MTTKTPTFNISSIIGNTKDEALDLNANRIFLVELTDIQRNPENPYDCNEIEELAENIEDQGLISPLTAYEDPNDGIVLLSGHRRKMALELLNSQGRTYRFQGKDITGKAPVIYTKKPLTSPMEMLNIISANAQRDMTNDEKNNVILKCQAAIHTLILQGKITKEKGQRERQLIASYTGISEHYIKDFFTEKNRNEKATFVDDDPQKEAKDKRSQEITEEQKIFRKHKKTAETYLDCLIKTRYQSLDPEQVDELKAIWKQIKEATDKLEW